MADRKPGGGIGGKAASMSPTAKPSTKRRMGDAGVGGADEVGNGSARDAKTGSDSIYRTGSVVDAEMRRFKAWIAKYEPVEREIQAERRKRAESSRRRAIARRKAFGDLCEMTDGMAKFCRYNGISLEEGRKMLNSFRPSLQAGAFVAVFEAVWLGAVFLRKELTRRIDRAKHEIARPYYYAQEKVRRQALAQERRRIRMRTTLNPCPTKEAILDAWVKVKESNEALLRFGSLMEDLECYVDNSLRRTEDGVIVGRRPGIKGWLQMEIPALYLKYTTVMAYKAAAKRMRQVLDISDPLPLSAVLGDVVKRQEKASDGNDVERITGSDGNRRDMCGEGKIKDYSADEIHSGEEGDKRKALCEADEVELLRARAVYLEVVKPVGDGVRRHAALVARLKSLTDPELVEECNMLESWKVKYRHKITV
ncbi:MAG: hypothetical protein IKK82_11325, partial [Kiritimatiellae bacterium]|nr:hypothetical protein [Kiritimatiellia bacterium]